MMRLYVKILFLSSLLKRMILQHFIGEKRREEGNRYTIPILQTIFQRREQHIGQLGRKCRIRMIKGLSRQIDMA
jgi:hypothetical protein